MSKKMFIVKTICLSFFVIWLGFLKFLPFEAELIAPMVESSPLTSILFNYLGVMGFSYFIGSVEIILAMLLLAGFFNPKVGFLAAAGFCCMFLVTISFLFTTPNVNKIIDGAFVTDFFLLKDVMFFIISIDLLTFHFNKLNKINLDLIHE
ncbi:DUF417 family protein [Vibrio jasicida]|uniref:DUF417 family protein n=1 Tax=Vibrio jasicida TaxID=766224 RepID=UPI0006ACA690|nr:DUF417 family protein [Vibrio jasicida]